jgi:anti-sigma factor (TIGR02949 family)
MSVGCRVVRRHVDALVDGELDSTTQVEFDQHLGGCPICREHVLFASSIKTATKRALTPPKAPEALRLRVLTALDAAPSPDVRRRESRPENRAEKRSLPPGSSAEMLTAPVAFAAPSAPRDARRGGRALQFAVPAAAAAAVLVVFGSPSDSSTTAPSIVPLVEDVVRRHSAPSPAEVSGPGNQMASLFRGTLGFAARPVEFKGNDHASLVGARLSNVRERDAAAFYYNVRGHRVTVMVFEPPPDGFAGAERVHMHGRDVYYRNVHGYTVPLVEEDGLAYAFTGDLDSGSMMRLAATARVGH